MKGVPQGSILGPALFNICLNDIVYFFERSILANFADDNTLIVQGENLQTVVNTLGQEGSIATDWFASNFMKANPDKFHFMSAAKKADAAVNTIEIESNSIQAEDSIKLLGVHIDSRLNFNKQISEVCKKAGRQINALKRLSFYLNYNARLTAFRCFILSHLNYSPLVWMNSSKVQMGKIEKLQERALRIVLRDNKSSYAKLLTMAGVPSMRDRYQSCLLKEVYKSVNHTNPNYINNLFTARETNYSLRGTHMLNLPKVNTTKYGLNSFTYKGAKSWNSLDNTQRSAESLQKFMKLV